MKRKRHVGLWAALVWFVAASASSFGQVELAVRLDSQRTILYEPVVVEVRLRNNSGRELVLGGAEATARLWLEVEQGPGRLLRPQDSDLVQTPWVIPAGETGRRRFRVSRVYDMRALGPYTMWVRLELAGRQFTSNRAFLDVVPGLELQRMVGGVAPETTEQRVYRLMTLNRDRGEQIFLRIDDEDRNICYAVIHLGRLVRVYQPQMRVDRRYRITVLHQAAPGRYFYQVFTPSGEEVTRRGYLSEKPGVQLVPTADGRYVVSGATSSSGPVTP